MDFIDKFPYTNFHELNMDWIIKIAKDFLDQYTHIQQIIEEGEQSLLDKTATGLASLQEKAENLEALLQAWYDTHSADIANQLASALQDLNNWYNLHQNYLDSTLATNIALFNQHAGEKAAETIASIPSDYTALAQQVADIDDRDYIDLRTLRYVRGYILNYEIITSPNYDFYNTGLVPIELLGITEIHYTFTKTDDIDFIAFYDAQKNGLSALTPQSTDPSTITGDITVPSGARYFAICYKKLVDTGAVFTGKVASAKSVRLVEAMPCDILPLAALQNEYIKADGTFGSFDGWKRSEYLPVKMLGLQAIEYELKKSNSICYVACYDANKLLVDYVKWESGGATYEHGIVNLNTDVEYVAICYNVASSYAVIKGYFTKAFPMVNKVIACFGDSITWQDGKVYGSTHSQSGHVAVGYETWLRVLTGAQVDNKGYNGHRMPTILPYVKAYDLTNIDVITLTAGANDFRTGSDTETLGQLAPIGSTFDETTFYGSFQSAVESVLTRKPTCKIILITPVKGWTASSGTLVYEMPTDYPDAIKAIGKLYGLPVCDWYYESGVNALTATTYLGDDNTLPYKVHPNNRAYYYMGKLLVDTINKI